MKKYLSNQIKYFTLFTFTGFCFLTTAQNSYEFAKPLPVETVAQKTVDPIYFGTYEGSKGAQFLYEINANGIHIQTINIQAISMKTLRESSKYSIKNEHIFGVNQDSIPYVFQDSSYYFGVRNTTPLIGENTSNQLHANGPGKYIVNFKTENGFTPISFEFIGNKLAVSDFDYDSEGKVFKKIKEQKNVPQTNSNLTSILLHPTLKEWQRVSNKELFGESQEYFKQ